MSRLIHRSKPSEPTFWRTSAKRAASWFLHCFSLSFVSSEDFGGIASLVLPRAPEALGCKWQQKGMNRGMDRKSIGGVNRGQNFLDRKDTKSTPGAQRQPVFRCDSGPGQTAVSTASDRLQEASSKFHRHSALQSPSVLRQAAPRMLQTTLVPGQPQDCSIIPSIGTFH